MPASTTNPTDLARIRDLLNQCPDTQLMMTEVGDDLVRHAVLEQHQPGSLLWSQGSPPLDVFVTSGPVRISILGAAGNLFTVSLVRDSHLIGETEVFVGIAARPNEACALIPQDVVRIPADEFLRCVESSVAITRAWLRISNQRFLLVAQHAGLLSQRSAEDRLQSVVKLLLLYTPANADGTILLPFSQEALGSMAALTRQATAKVVADWRSRGLVDTRYQNLCVLQAEHFKKKKADR